ncbi:MAG TPA: FAD-dependent oxidoreductase [Xanthobacteraceae bacterium]
MQLPKRTTKDIVIVGAGCTGLGAARHLTSCGRDDWVLLEELDRPGGLARSFKDAAGFTWDIGGHVQFSHYKLFDDAMLEFLGEDGWLRHERESWVWMRERFIPYPLQNNVHRLPPEDLDNCLQGLLGIIRQPRSRPGDFGAWIDANFGPGLADVFMRPYNKKVWAFPPEMMNASWVGERVALTDLSRVLRNLVFGRDDVSWGPNNTFQFPKVGGTGAIWEACAASLPSHALNFSARVVDIDLNNQSLQTADGHVITYGTLISTMPLPELIKVSRRADLIPMANKGLLHSSCNIVGLGMRGRPKPDLATKCWIYFPEDNCPFYRATVFSNYSPANVPDPNQNWSLMCEVSESPHKRIDQASLVEEVITGALNTRLISDRSDIVTVWSYRAPYGYPTPGLHRDETLREIIPEFERCGVYSRGRFGMWRYEVSNQDHSFMQGVEVVERLLNGRPEVTANNPDLANSKKHPWPFEHWQQ